MKDLRKKLVVTGLYFGTAVLLFAQTPAVDDASSTRVPLATSVMKKPVYHWVQNGQSDGLTTYYSNVEGTGLVALKGDGIVDAPIEKVASVIIDTTRGTEWIDSLVSSKVVRSLSPAEFIEYDHVGIPFPFDTLISGRDFVFHVYVTSNASADGLTVSYIPTEDPDTPPVRSLVRGVMFCQFKLTPMTLGDETYVQAEVHCDPKGGLPAWLVNFFQEDWPNTTFHNLRQEMTKPDIEVLPVVAELLKGRASVIIEKTGSGP